MFFKIYETYRTPTQQRREFAEVREEIRAAHPELDEAQLYDRTSQFSADPDTLPPHCTGAAIDLTIADKNGIELDMGTPLNSIDAASSHAAKLPSPACENRALLLSLMLDAGFAPHAMEWWHYSYGDIRWASYQNASVLYDIVEG